MVKQVSMRCLVYLVGVYSVCVVLPAVWGVVPPRELLDESFKNCKIKRPNFDLCVKMALNRITPLFQTGVPEYGVPSFDPLYAESVNSTLGNSAANFTYRLDKVVERDWTKVHFIQFKSDLENNWIQFTTFFPDKRISGDYDIQISVPGMTFKRTGGFYFRFFDYVKTTTITWPPGVEGGPLTAELNTRSVRDAVFEYTNLQHGNFIIENQLNNFINANAQEFFGLQKPLLDEMASKVFTEMYNKAFKDFPFKAIFT